MVHQVCVCLQTSKDVPTLTWLGPGWFVGAGRGRSRTESPAPRFSWGHVSCPGWTRAPRSAPEDGPEAAEQQRILPAAAWQQVQQNPGAAAGPKRSCEKTCSSSYSNKSLQVLYSTTCGQEDELQPHRCCSQIKKSNKMSSLLNNYSFKMHNAMS